MKFLIDPFMRQQMEKNSRPKCNFIHCFAGMGVAGAGSCFLGGQPENPNCPAFKDEGEALAEWKKEDQMANIRCQTCGWVGKEMDLEAPWSDMEPGCPHCRGTDLVDVDNE